jgi:hypothetical protein
MPWHVTNDRAECDGYAVVKDATGEIVGCHATQNQANKQLAALHIAEPNMRDLDPGEVWTPKQQALYATYEQLVETTGMFNQGVDGDGAHYGPESPFANEGLICANCVFYEGGQKCELVSGNIAPGGICKLWIINAKLTQQRAGSGPLAIITDIDGTLISGTNGVNGSLIQTLNRSSAVIIVVTARNTSQRDATIALLDRIGLQYDSLQMSEGGNPTTYKKATAERLLKRYTINTAYENNADTRAAYKELGIDAKAPYANRAAVEEILAQSPSKY